MNIPDKVRLNGITYDVIWKDDMFVDEERLDGKINFSRNTIELNKSSQSYQNACRTFIHELVHFILYEYTADNDDSRIPEDEEDLCELMSKGLYQILEDNKLY